MQAPTMTRRKLNERSKCGGVFHEFHSFVFLIFTLACISFGSNIAHAEDADFSPYARAVEFCRGNVKRPLAFDLDQRVLCFDGVLSTALDISQASGLKQNGLFVVRSPGGDVLVAATLADTLRDRNATVVVYDYCFSACASYLLLASHQAFVLRNTLVAWHYTIDPRWCPSLVATKRMVPGALKSRRVLTLRLMFRTATNIADI
jgi:hypothetical protein